MRNDAAFYYSVFFINEHRLIGFQKDLVKVYFQIQVRHHHLKFSM
jgi:hypothetical protein